MSNGKKKASGQEPKARGPQSQQGQQPAGPADHLPRQIDPGTVAITDLTTSTVVGWGFRASGSNQEHWILMTGSPKYVAPPARAVKIDRNTSLCGSGGCASLSAFLSACQQALGGNTAVYVIYTQTQNQPFPPG